MSTITVVAADVMPVEIFEQFTLPAVEAVTAGQYVRMSTAATGSVELGNASSAAEVGYRKGIALHAAAVGEALTVVKKGIVCLGESALSALAFEDRIYLSDTDGTLQTTAGTVSTVVGTVFPGNANTTPDHLLWVDL
jgi:predicted RecA/RadA family phage recombinase